MKMGITSNNLSEKAATGTPGRRVTTGESPSQKSPASSLPLMGNTYMRRPVNNSTTQQRNKYLSENDRPLAYQLTRMERTARIQAVIVEFAGTEGDAVKKVAEALECSIGTAKNYLNGNTTPAGEYDERAMFAIPGYLALKAELSGMRMALDPRHQAKMVEMYRYMQMQAETIFGGATA